jgi:hypothetical protein
MGSPPLSALHPTRICGSAIEPFGRAQSPLLMTGSEAKGTRANMRAMATQSPAMRLMWELANLQLTSRVQPFVLSFCVVATMVGTIAAEPEALLITGTANGVRPHTSIVGATNVPFVMQCTFALTIHTNKPSLEMAISDPLPSRVEGIVFVEDQEILSFHSGVSGTAEFGPAKGRWEAVAYVRYGEVPEAWADFPTTIMVPFWRDRYPVTGSFSIPDHRTRQSRDLGRPPLRAEAKGNLPLPGSELRLYGSRNRIAERWVFLRSTNVSGVELPLTFRHEIIAGRPITPNAIESLSPQDSTKWSQVWNVQVGEIRVASQTPSRPEPSRPVKVHDFRLEWPVEYITESWRSVDDLRRDPTILSQLRERNAGFPGRGTRTVSPGRTLTLAFYVFLVVTISILAFGLIKIKKGGGGRGG